MKKSLIALAAFAAVASAQADVTIYGNLDPSIIANKMSVTGNAATSGTVPLSGTSTTFGTSSAQDKSSQLGFKGSETLYGTTKVIFDLQGDLTLGNGLMGNTNSGASGAGAAAAGSAASGTGAIIAPSADVFNRNAYVGIQSDVGTLRVGRQFTPFHENQVNDDAFGSNSGGMLAVTSQLTTAGSFGLNMKSNISNFGNQNTGVNSYGAYANGISFELPTMNGVTVKAFQTWGNGTGVGTTNAAQSLPFQSSGISSLKAVWDVTPAIKLNAAYQVTRAGQAPMPGTSAAASAAGTVGTSGYTAATGADVYACAVAGVALTNGACGIAAGSTFSALSAVTPGTQVITASMFGGQFTTGQFRFTASQFRLTQAIAGFDSAIATHGGVLYAYSPVLDLGLEYTAVKDTSITTNTANITSATARYKLSKTTYVWALYGTAANAGASVMNPNYSGVGTTSATGGTVNSSVSSGISYSF